MKPARELDEQEKARLNTPWRRALRKATRPFTARGRQIRRWERELEGAPGRDRERRVRQLVAAVDRMRDDWAEAAPPGQRLSDRQQELWRAVHEAADKVRGDQ